MTGPSKAEPKQEPRNDLGVENIDGELVILDKANNKVHQLNATASEIWTRLAAGQVNTTIADAIVELFDVSHNAALRDVNRVVDEFRTMGLLDHQRA